MKEKLLSELEGVLAKKADLILVAAKGFLQKDDYYSVISMLEKPVNTYIEKTTRNTKKDELFKYYVKCLGLSCYALKEDKKAKKYFDYLAREYDDKEGLELKDNELIVLFNDQHYYFSDPQRAPSQTSIYSKEELHQYALEQLELNKKFSFNIQKFQSATAANVNSGNTFVSPQTLSPNTIVIDPNQEYIIKNELHKSGRDSKKQKINTSIYTIVNQKAIFLDSYYTNFKEQLKKVEVVDISGSPLSEDYE